MKRLMEELRANAPRRIADAAVTNIVDYATGVDMPIIGGTGSDAPQKLPCANVVEFQLKGGHKLIIRPSGTEPKVKAYAFVKGEDEQQAMQLLHLLEDAARELLA